MARPLAPRGQGRARVIDAALKTFAVHGVSGASLQMIADHLGVTKAAVYYQFKAKEDIVLAVVEEAFAEMRSFLEAAEAVGPGDPDEATRIAVAGFVDLMIGHRQVVAALARDPEVARIIESHAELSLLSQRLVALLLGPAPDLRRRVAVSVLGAGVAQAGIDPHLEDVEDDVLRAALSTLATGLILP